MATHASDVIESVRTMPDVLASWAHVPRAWLARRAGAADIARLQATRTAAMIRHARAHSPFYRTHWRGVRNEPELRELPPVTRSELMAHFDAWVVDPSVTRAGVERFLADPANVARRYLDRYFVWTSSGTSGVPGIYVQDLDAMAVYDAMVALQACAGGAAYRASQAWTTGGRAALVAVATGHYASVATFLRTARSMPWAQARVFSILTPLPELCAKLAAFDPAFLAGYPTVLQLLAREQLEGRLALRPAAIWSGGECLYAAAHAEISRAFDCGVVEEYGASECMNLGFRCSAGWLHVNADWAVLEPVDRDYRPVPPGRASDTVLLTNLANRVQPIIRYDLGDSVLVRPAPCECGNPLPAIRVEGRSDEVLQMTDTHHASVRLLPLAFDTVIETALGGCPYQIVQTAPHALAVRLQPPCDVELAAAWARAQPALRAWLDAQGLANVALALDRTSPHKDASGKLRHVLPLRHRRTEAELALTADRSHGGSPRPRGSSAPSHP